ncbi:unnamed protein product [Linum trigynum]|uniref:Reverse transcriptase zinc-binding domain-containing protein n=1 Tax=Linum trigynum TaxID=586398 RepID=A0AAV2DPP2_9ROSI
MFLKPLRLSYPISWVCLARTEWGNLGVPTEWGRSKKEVFAGLIARMENMGQSWKSLALSQAGKETLLKAVYQSYPTYLMSCYLIPKGTTKIMDARLRAFFWGGNMDKGSIHWRKGSVLTALKHEGGMGFKDFHQFNLALLAKQGWRILNGDQETWVRLLKGLYFLNSDFMNAGKGRKPSWIWSSICEAREVLKLGARKNMGNGRSIDIDNDPWIPTLPGFKLQQNQRQQLKAFEWIMNDGRDWNLDLIEQTCLPDEVEAIKRIPIGMDNLEDSWVWYPEKSGAFSVKSAYHLFRTSERNRTGSEDPNHPDCTSKAWKWLWSLSLPPKIKNFIWRITRNAVATKRNLWFRKVITSPVCTLCEEEIEDVWHCLFGCPHAVLIWQRSFAGIPLPHPSLPILMWLFHLNDVISFSSMVAVIAILWAIWNARNGWIFGGTRPLLHPTLSKAIDCFNEWSGLLPLPSTSSPPQPPPSCSRIDPPPSLLQQEIHCDGAFVSESQVAAYGVVVRNHHGQVIDGKAGTLFCSSSIVAEAKALLIAMRMAQDSGLPTVIFSDCLVIINILLGRSRSWPWQVKA